MEILFNGAADAMRRRILAPLKQGLETFSKIAPQQLKVLDVACGTGRTLRMIRGALPKISLCTKNTSTKHTIVLFSPPSPHH